MMDPKRQAELVNKLQCILLQGADELAMVNRKQEEILNLLSEFGLLVHKPA